MFFSFFFLKKGCFWGVARGWKSVALFVKKKSFFRTHFCDFSKFGVFLGFFWFFGGAWLQFKKKVTFLFWRTLKRRLINKSYFLFPTIGAEIFFVFFFSKSVISDAKSYSKPGWVHILGQIWKSERASARGAR